MAGLLLASAVVFAGCSTNGAQGREWRKIAKDKAVDFVCEKYDFDEDDLKIKNVRSRREGHDEFSITYTECPETWVTMSYEGKEFIVEVNAAEKDDDLSKDNYQQEEITKALTDIIKDESDLDIKDVCIKYSYNAYQYPKYLVHDKYEVSKKADNEEKIEALMEVFNYEYDKILGSPNKNCEEVFIYIATIDEDADDIERDIEKLSGMLKFTELELFELSFENKSMMKEAGEDIYVAYRAEYIEYGYYLNAVGHFHGQEKYKAELNVKEYEKCEIGEFTCIVIGCDPDDVSIKAKDNDSKITAKFGSEYKTVSDMYIVDMPEDAQLFIYLDSDEYDSDVSIAVITPDDGKNWSEKDRTGVLSKGGLQSGKNDERFYVTAKDGLKFCFVKK